MLKGVPLTNGSDVSHLKMSEAEHSSYPQIQSEVLTYKYELPTRFRIFLGDSVRVVIAQSV
jgi:hypothetical protein